MEARHPFADALRQVHDRLDLPGSVRRRVLLELAADLQAMAAELVAQGSEPEAARQRALEFVDLGEDAVDELARVHGGALRRWTDGISEVARGRAEHLALLLVAASLLHFAIQLGIAGSLLALAGPLGWSTLAAVAATMLLGFVALYRHRARGDHRPSSSRGIVLWMERLALLQVLVVSVGLGLGLFQMLAFLRETPTQALAGNELEALAPATRLGLGLVHASIARMALGALGLMLSILLWQRLAQRLRDLEDEQLDLLRELDLEPRSPRSSVTQSRPVEIPCSN